MVEDEKCNHILNHEETFCTKCLKPTWQIAHENGNSRIEAIEKKFAPEFMEQYYMPHITDIFKEIAEIKEYIDIQIKEIHTRSHNQAEKIEAVLREHYIKEIEWSDLYSRAKTITNPAERREFYREQLERLGGGKSVATIGGLGGYLGETPHDPLTEPEPVEPKKPEDKHYNALEELRDKWDKEKEPIMNCTTCKHNYDNSENCHCCGTGYLEWEPKEKEPLGVAWLDNTPEGWERTNKDWDKEPTEDIKISNSKLTHITYCPKCNGRVEVHCHFYKNDPIEIERADLENLFFRLEGQKIEYNIIKDILEPFQKKYLEEMK